MTGFDNPPRQWEQANLHFNHGADAEGVAACFLLPILRAVESRGLVSGWFFVRKSPSWRLRYRPHSEAAHGQPQQVIAETLTALVAEGRLSSWVPVVYEPETFAFGGAASMDLAHDLFCADSRFVLDYLLHRQTGHIPTELRSELAALLCGALMRAAGTEWYEQGDIWAHVAEHRPTVPRPDSTITTSIQRFLTVDIDPPASLPASLEFASEWFAAYRGTGRTLRTLSETGRLTRGIRGILVHHVLFCWNRLGLPELVQARIASAAAEVVFADPPPQATQRASVTTREG